MTFELTVQSAAGWVNGHGLNPEGRPLTARELRGGISASVVSVSGNGIGIVLKQALPRLRVDDLWEASPERSVAGDYFHSELP